MTQGRLLVGGNYAHSGSSSTYVTLGRLPEWPEAAAAERVLTCSHPALPSAVPSPLYGAVERHGRRSGGLAGTFTPKANLSEIVIFVPVSPASLASVRVPGLTAEFAEAVLQGFQKLAPSPMLASLGAGRLDIHPAWWHEIDSGAYGFHDLPARLVGVLSMPPEASGEDVWNCWRVQNEALELAPVLSWLSSTLVHWPERALFGPGASPSALAALEGSLGFPLPELLRRLLLCVNGGRFGDQQPASASPPPRFRLLATEEIAPAYFRLGAAQRRHTDAPLSTSRIPLFFLRDGTLVRWPFLPIARDLDTDALLVLEVLPVPYRNAIQLATPGNAWIEWPVLHRRFVDFLEAFLTKDFDPGASSSSGVESQ